MPATTTAAAYCTGSLCCLAYSNNMTDKLFIPKLKRQERQEKHDKQSKRDGTRQESQKRQDLDLLGRERGSAA